MAMVGARLFGAWADHVAYGYGRGLQRDRKDL